MRMASLNKDHLNSLGVSLQSVMSRLLPMSLVEGIGRTERQGSGN